MTLPRVELEHAEPAARGILEETKKRIKMIPNMYAFMANSPGALETYTYGYQRFREQSGFTPAEQEVVFLAISVENGCEYCVAAHSVIADTVSRVPRAVTEALRDRTEIPDAKLRALAALARAMVVKRGRPSPEEVQTFLDAGYTERQVLELVLAAAVKTISNYTNHLFETPVDAPFRARGWKAA
jgi:uncharacterized peroxidase-related enzyme